MTQRARKSSQRELDVFVAELGTLARKLLKRKMPMHAGVFVGTSLLSASAAAAAQMNDLVRRGNAAQTAGRKGEVMRLDLKEDAAVLYFRLVRLEINASGQCEDPACAIVELRIVHRALDGVVHHEAVGQMD